MRLDALALEALLTSMASLCCPQTRIFPPSGRLMVSPMPSPCTKRDLWLACVRALVQKPEGAHGICRRRLVCVCSTSNAVTYRNARPCRVFRDGRSVSSLQDEDRLSGTDVSASSTKLGSNAARRVCAQL